MAKVRYARGGTPLFFPLLIGNGLRCHSTALSSPHNPSLKLRMLRKEREEGQWGSGAVGFCVSWCLGAPKTFGVVAKNQNVSFWKTIKNATKTLRLEGSRRSVFLYIF